MKKTSFIQKSVIESAVLNQRFADLLGGSILNGFRLTKGTSNYAVSLLRGNTDPHALVTRDGKRFEETDDVQNVVTVVPNTGSGDRFDVLYLNYANPTTLDPFTYEVIRGTNGLPVDILKTTGVRQTLGIIRVRPNQSLATEDLTSLPLGVRLGGAVFDKPVYFEGGVFLDGAKVLAEKSVDDKVEAATGTLRTNQVTLLEEVASFKKVLAANQQTSIIDLATDKSLYRPTERVVFSAYLSGSLGTIETAAYAGDRLVYSEKVAVTKPGHLTWQWYLPDVDKVGYLVRVTYERPDGVKQTEEIAVHVDNNWINFPIYGFLSQFGAQNDRQLEDNMNRLKRRHINGIQYYDWFDRHHIPLNANELGMCSQFWLDFGKRPTQIDMIKRYIQLAQRANIASMQYGLIYGSGTGQKVDGLTEEMFLYSDTTKTNVLKQVLTPWAKNDLYLMNPLNEAWQAYISEQMARVYDFLNFDGWHVDQLGKLTNTSYNNTGSNADWGVYNEGFGFLLKKAKARRPDKLLVMNAVSNYAHAQIIQSGVVAFAYTEVWVETQTYQQLKGLIDNVQGLNANAPVVIAGYMNYDFAKANQTGRFNAPGVLLMDAICFANGATRIELGEHMLENEYFPQHHLTTDHFDDQLTKYYDFLVAYRPYLTRMSNKTLNVTSTTHTISTSFEAGKVTALVKENTTHVSVHLINLTGITDVNWRDTNANKPRPTLLTNVKLTIPQGGKKVWLATPDGETLLATTLDGVKASYTVTLPKLDIWSMVVIEK